MSNHKPYNYYPLLLLMTALILGVTILGLMHQYSSQLPAPRVSSSEAFNEKARWMRLRKPSCDLLIVGSSIALNNIDGKHINDVTKNSTANLSSFGLNPTDVANQLYRLPKSCKPKTIIYIFFRDDLTSRWDKMIDWDAYSRYIEGELDFKSYARNMDLSYYISTALKRSAHKKAGNHSFQSLDFDSTGSVQLSSSNFNYDKTRWIEFTKDRPLSISDLEIALKGIEGVVKAAERLDAKILLVSTPLNTSSKAYYKNIDQDLWSRVEYYSKKNHVEFIDLNNQGDLPDTSYSDFVHMNENGARYVADQLIIALQNHHR